MAKRTFQHTGTLAQLCVPVCFLLLVSCMAGKKTNPFQEVRLDVEYPFMTDQDDTAKLLRDTVRIQYLGDTVLYLLPKVWFDLNEQWEAENFRKGIDYFMFLKGNRTGVFIRNLVPEADVLKLPVDSLLDKRAFHNEYNTRGMRLERTEILPGRQRFVEKYTIEVKGEDGYDSIYYNYDRQMRNLPYSFSKGRDSITGAKLYKVQVILNEKYFQQYKRVVPRREFIVQFSGTPNNNPDTFYKVRDFIKSRGVSL